MKRLSADGRQRAVRFLTTEARPLERALYRYSFEGVAADEVLQALAAFQNQDGGFGRGLEPDIRAPISSALATSVAFQTLRELKAPADHPVVRGGIAYLLATYDPERRVWPIVPPAVADAPHAPWWDYDDELPQRFGGYLANPRAELAGYLFDYAALVPGGLHESLLTEVIDHLEATPEAMDMHDLLCYTRLAETETLPAGARDRLMAKLARAVEAVVGRDAASWEQYGLKPLNVASSPGSPFAPMLSEAIEGNLDYEIERQGADGAWAPNWSWFGGYPETWPEAERDWKGVLTLGTLRSLQRFGRLG